MPHAIAADQLVHDLVGRRRVALWPPALHLESSRGAQCCTGACPARRGARDVPVALRRRHPRRASRRSGGRGRPLHTGRFRPGFREPWSDLRRFARGLRPVESTWARCRRWPPSRRSSKRSRPSSPKADSSIARRLAPNIALRALSDAWPWPADLPVLLLDLPLRRDVEQKLLAAILARTSRALPTVVEGDRRLWLIDAARLRSGLAESP